MLEGDVVNIIKMLNTEEDDSDMRIYKMTLDHTYNELELRIFSGLAEQCQESY